MRWECRHAPAEMLYLEVRPDGVYRYFDHSPGRPEVWPLAAVIAGEHDRFVRLLFGEAAVAQLMAEIRRVAGRPADS